ncbi:MAG: hypothetical protein NZ839_00615 [Endomicrobia bacterium]|nr:hypothetical protein [Endomicrobiia bacterium]
MSKKIIFFYSKQSELPPRLTAEYQIKAIPLKKSNIKNNILEVKPQIIMFDENVNIKYVKSVCEQFKFIPVCVIGQFEDSSRLEKFLHLGVTVVNSSLPEVEMISIINNLLWFSLSREELWDDEYKLSKKEFLRKKLLIIAEVAIAICVLTVLPFLLSKVYNMVFTPQQLFSEVDIRYINPTDITVFDNRYLINDWMVKNLFEYEESSDELIKMYFPEKPLHSVSINERKYGVMSSMLTNSVCLFKYPEFSVICSTINFFQGKTVLSVSIDEENQIYILDNKGGLYKYFLRSDDKLFFVSSTTIAEFFPIDLCSVDEYLLFLDNQNNLYLTKKDKLQIITTILIDKFFETENTKFTSIDVGKTCIYLISEKSKKLVKIPKKIIFS